MKVIYLFQDSSYEFIRRNLSTPNPSDLLEPDSTPIVTLIDPLKEPLKEPTQTKASNFEGSATNSIFPSSRRGAQDSFRYGIFGGFGVEGSGV